MRKALGKKIRAVTITGALAASVLVLPAASANASGYQCDTRDSVHLDSGVTQVDANLAYCHGDGLQSYFLVSGRLSDTSCDNRAAYLDLWPNGGNAQDTVEDGNGCGTNKLFSFTYNPPIWSVHLRTRACGSGWFNGCSSFDANDLYS